MRANRVKSGSLCLCTFALACSLSCFGADARARSWVEPELDLEDDLSLGGSLSPWDLERFEHGRELKAMTIAKASVESIRNKRFDSTFVVQNLYGRGFDPRTTQGQKDKQMFVLGLHNSGTSVATRLIMLMGAFQGNVDDITISKRNMLKYWERKDVFWTADRFLKNYCDPKFMPFQGQGIDFSHVQKSHVDSLLLIAERTVADVSRHEPFVIKDPRLCWTFEFWKPLLDRPLCVIVYKDPIENSISLAENYLKSNWKKGGNQTSQMTAQHWLSTWESMTMHALNGCVGVPTVVFSSKHLKSDMFYSVDYLYKALTNAGAEHLRSPDKAEVDAQVMFHYDESHVTKKDWCKDGEANGETDTSKTPCSIVPTYSNEQAALNKVMESTFEEVMQDLSSIEPAKVAQTILDRVEKMLPPAEWKKLVDSHPMPVTDSFT